MKTVAAFTAGLILSVSNLFAGSLSNYGTGVSFPKFNNTDANPGIYVVFDTMTMSEAFQGFGYGIGFDANFFYTKSNGAAREYPAYTMGVQAKAGYSFEERFDVPLKLKAGVGYGATHALDENGWGVQYEASAEYTIYDRYGLGVKYHFAKAAHNDNNVDIDSVMFYIARAF